MKQRLTGMVATLSLFAACACAQGSLQATGAIQGLVFTTDPDGGRSLVSKSKISLDGPSHFEYAVEALRSRNFPGDIKPMGAAGVDAGREFEEAERLESAAPLL